MKKEPTNRIIEKLKAENKKLKKDIRNRKNYASWLQGCGSDTPMRSYRWWLQKEEFIKGPQNGADKH